MSEPIQQLLLHAKGIQSLQFMGALSMFSSESGQTGVQALFAVV